MATAMTQVRTLQEVMEERGRASRGEIDVEAGLNAMVADMAPWHHDDLRHSEVAEYDDIIGTASELAEKAAIRTAAEYIADALRQRRIPQSMIDHPDSETLRADIATVESVR